MTAALNDHTVPPCGMSVIHCCHCAWCEHVAPAAPEHISATFAWGGCELLAALEEKLEPARCGHVCSDRHRLRVCAIGIGAEGLEQAKRAEWCHFQGRTLRPYDCGPITVSCVGPRLVLVYVHRHVPTCLRVHALYTIVNSLTGAWVVWGTCDHVQRQPAE